jgi:hypothetical protein
MSTEDFQAKTLADVPVEMTAGVAKGHVETPGSGEYAQADILWPRTIAEDEGSQDRHEPHADALAPAEDARVVSQCEAQDEYSHAERDQSQDQDTDGQERSCALVHIFPLEIDAGKQGAMDAHEICEDRERETDQQKTKGQTLLFWSLQQQPCGPRHQAEV